MNKALEILQKSLQNLKHQISEIHASIEVAVVGLEALDAKHESLFREQISIQDAIEALSKKEEKPSVSKNKKTK